MSVEGSFVAEEVIAPDLADKLFTCEGKSLVLNHIEEQLVLLRSHLDSLAVDCYDSCRKINRKSLVDKHVLFSLFALLTAGLIYEYFFKRMPLTAFERWCIAAIYGGGLGNIIDRVRLGYVVDMIETEFIRFPVFNVADCFITCGCIALLIHLVFFNRNFWKEEKK